MTAPLGVSAVVVATRHPNDKDLRLTAYLGTHTLAVESVAADATVGEALAALQRLEQIANGEALTA